LINLGYVALRLESAQSLAGEREQRRRELAEILADIGPYEVVAQASIEAYSRPVWMIFDVGVSQ